MNPLEDPINKAQKTSRWYKILLNKYLIIGVFFIVWIAFFDQNSYLIHRELDKEINQLTIQKEYYQNKLDKEIDQIEKMKKDTTEIERIAREKHFLKKENEDVFIVETQKVKKTISDE